METSVAFIGNGFNSVVGRSESMVNSEFPPGPQFKTYPRAMKLRLILLSLLLPFAPALAARGEMPTPEQVEFFEKKVRPVLVAKCFECHGAENEESELQVDSLAELLAGGTRGPAIVPGKPQESLLIRAIGHGETLQMPLKKKLPAGEIADLTKWVRDGAIWPGENAKPAATVPVSKIWQITEQQKGHWAFQEVRDAIPPGVHDAICSQSP